MVYLILGMHKSGTTLISKILHESGINMGNFNFSTSRDYDKGNHYERFETNEINKKILSCKNVKSYKTIFTPIFNNYETNYYDESIKLVKALNYSYQNWGFKDPRTCLTYHFWHDLLEDHRIIAIIRHPAEVWNHYYTRVNILDKLVRGIYLSFYFLRAWYIYNNSVYKIVNNYLDDSIVIDYTSFMENSSELEKLNKFIGADLKDFREHQLYRSNSNKSLLYKVTAGVMKYMCKIDVENLFTLLLDLTTSNPNKSLSKKKSYQVYPNML